MEVRLCPRRARGGWEDPDKVDRPGDSQVPKDKAAILSGLALFDLRDLKRVYILESKLQDSEPLLNKPLPVLVT